MKRTILYLLGLLLYASLSLVMLSSCTKKDADPYKDFEFVKVSQRFTQHYERFCMSVYRLQPTDTTINGQSANVQTYHRYNLQDMQSSTEAGLYLFKQTDSMAVYVPNESLPGYVLLFNGLNEYKRDTLRGDTSVILSVKMAQFFVDNNPLNRI